MMNITKNKKTLSNGERKNIYPFIKRENDYSNTVALEGFSEKKWIPFSILFKKIRKI